MSSSNLDPPYYVLVAQSHLPSPGAGPSSATPSTLVHPVIQYHFADDSPQALLPTSAGESVILLDYVSDTDRPIAGSAHKNVAVTGVKVTDAPGAGAAGDPKRNNKMYIIETIVGPTDEPLPETGANDLDDPRQIIAQFTERNAALKRVLDLPTLGLTDGSTGAGILG